MTGKCLLPCLACALILTPALAVSPPPSSPSSSSSSFSAHLLFVSSSPSSISLLAFHFLGKSFPHYLLESRGWGIGRSTQSHFIGLVDVKQSGLLLSQVAQEKVSLMLNLFKRS